MSDMRSNPEPETNLYGKPESEVAPPPQKGQSVSEQLVGMFTEPSVVFQRLRKAPAWGGAFLVTLGAALFATLAWAAKVDVEAAARRKFEVMEQAFRMNIPSDVMDKAMEQAATQGQPFVSSILSVAILVPLFTLIMAAILFAFSKFGGEDEEVSFRHAWAAVIVHGLSMLPIAVLAGIMCLIRNVGGAASYANMAPSTLSFWIQPENPWVRGLLAVIDPFYLFSFVALFLAGRYTLRLKPWANITVVALMGLFGFIGHFFGGMF